ncbi:hypothetical protein FPOAC2_00218 [Fusarium poae]
MSSSTVNKTTYKVRTDHVFWECEGCGAINSMEHHIIFALTAPNHDWGSPWL